MKIPANKTAVRALVALAIFVSPSFEAGAADDNPAQAEAVQAAEAAAKEWLALVDEGDYDQSWKETAPFFQENVPEALWSTQLDAVRKPLGAVHSRELIDAQFATQLPGAPAGEYVVLQYKTSFEGKHDAVETVTPMKDSEGVWRVSGYFIR